MTFSPELLNKIPGKDPIIWLATQVDRLQSSQTLHHLLNSAESSLAITNAVHIAVAHAMHDASQDLYDQNLSLFYTLIHPNYPLSISPKLLTRPKVRGKPYGLFPTIGLAYGRLRIKDTKKDVVAFNLSPDGELEFAAISTSKRPEPIPTSNLAMVLTRAVTEYSHEPVSPRLAGIDHSYQTQFTPKGVAWLDGLARSQV